jgi:hypothetical protein
MANYVILNKQTVISATQLEEMAKRYNVDVQVSERPGTTTVLATPDFRIEFTSEDDGNNGLNFRVSSVEQSSDKFNPLYDPDA